MKGLDATQVEQLRQIAEYLSYQREQQGIPLEKIANQTYIPLRLLRALDSLQLEQLPEPVYIRGFIRRYADALGLDGMEIADAFPVESVIPDPVPDEASEPAVEVQPAGYEPLRSDERSEKPGFSSRPLLFVGIGAAVLVGAIALGALSFFKRPAASPPQPTTSQTELPAGTAKAPVQSSSNAPANSKAITPIPSPKATSPSSTAVSPSSVQADVSLTDRSWVQVTADGKAAFEGTLEQGEQRTWTAQKNLMITAGNAGAVVLSCNQGAAKVVGKTGEVVDATCPTTKGKTNQAAPR